MRQYSQADINFFREQNRKKPVEMPPHLISEYVQGTRVFPMGSPKPGPQDLHLTPYVIEIMDAAGPYSGINRISVLKGVQIALTTMMENIMAYYMGANPAEIMYCTATDALLKKWFKRLDSMIDSMGFRGENGIIHSQSERPKSRKSGDTDYSKEYTGGSLTMSSLQSPASMRSESNRILLIDEVDAAPKETTTGEGNYLGILDGRTAAYGSNWKVVNTSTPATLDGSVIFPEFEAGDQRYYNVPCLMCGAYFVFDYKYIVPITDKHGYLERVFHECPSCNKEIWNNDKHEMMRVDHAKWEPTAKPEDKTHRSYQISGLYSPFAAWERVYKAEQKAQEDPTLKPSFRNLWEGLPYKEEGSRPDYKEVMKRAGNYKAGTVPDDVLFLTMSGDVQLGKEKYQKMSPDDLEKVTKELIAAKGANNVWKTERLPRLEFEVMGVGMKYKSWMIKYIVIYGHTTKGAYEGAYKKLRKMIEDGEFTYEKKDGRSLSPVMVFLDASEGKTRQTVFDFCQDWPKVFPVVNQGYLNASKNKGVEEVSPFDIKKYELKNKSKFGGVHYMLSVNYYKTRLYRNLNTPRNYTGDQSPMFCDFPIDTPKHYFKMLTAEDMLVNGGFHRSESVAAESLDCRTYNLAIEDIFLDIKVEEARRNMKNTRYTKGAHKGDRMYTDAEVDQIGKKWVLAQYGN